MTTPPPPEAVEAAFKLAMVRRTRETIRERIRLGQILMEADPNGAILSADAQAARILAAEVERLRAEIHKIKRMADDRSHQVTSPKVTRMFEEIEDAAHAALAKHAKEGGR